MRIRNRKECAMPFALKSATHQIGRKPRRFVPGCDQLEDRVTPANAVDPILEWNAVMLNANGVDHGRAAPEQGGPDMTARAFAIVSVAMYDAFNSTENIGEKYLTKVPFGTFGDSSAAFAQAAHDTLIALYPSQSAAFDAALEKTLQPRAQRRFGESRAERRPYRRGRHSSSASP